MTNLPYATKSLVVLYIDLSIDETEISLKKDVTCGFGIILLICDACSYSKIEFSHTELSAVYSIKEYFTITSGS